MTIETRTLPKQASDIKLLILDVDGILTDGKLYFSETGESLKVFHVHDGLGIKLLLAAGIDVAVISSREHPIVTQRLTSLGIPHIYQGQKHKLQAFEDCLSQLKLAPEQVAYMGDDIIDLPVLNRVGLSLTVANAQAPVKMACDFVTDLKGGKGAVREVCNLLLAAQSKLDAILETYRV